MTATNVVTATRHTTVPTRRSVDPIALLATVVMLIVVVVVVGRVSCVFKKLREAL
jgi:hypothetical protein